MFLEMRRRVFFFVGAFSAIAWLIIHLCEQGSVARLATPVWPGKGSRAGFQEGEEGVKMLDKIQLREKHDPLARLFRSLLLPRGIE